MRPRCLSLRSCPESEESPSHRVMTAKQVRVPIELLRTLELLHSYVLAKRLVKHEDHEGAARMLLRCVDDLSRFKANSVALLTTTVVESHRAGLKKAAYDYSMMLMEPQYRDSIDPKLKRKVEALVRRPNTTQKDEDTSPCPACGFGLGAWQLDCPSCKTHLPFCVVSGRHMTLDDWSSCPRCSWPALFSHIGRLAEVDPVCPMCEQTVARGTPRLSRDPAGELRSYVQQSDEPDKQAGPPGEASSAAAKAATAASSAAAAAAASSSAAPVAKPARSGAAMAAAAALGLS